MKPNMAVLTLGQNQTARDIAKSIAWTVGSISFVVFVALFGSLPIFRRTPIGWLNRLVLKQIPHLLMEVDAKITGKRVTRGVLRVYDYLMYDRHPVVMLVFIALQLGSEALFIPPASRYLTQLDKYVLFPMCLTPLITLYLSYATNSHHISARSYQTALSRYPYDYILYHPHQMCRTCQRPKPARSKHCPTCKSCIERHDHHCIWINNCVGLHNYLYFCLLLVSIFLLLVYGARLGCRVLDQILQDHYVPARITAGSVTSKRWDTGIGWKEWFSLYSLAIASNPRIGGVTLLATMCAPLSFGFLAYHAYLIWAGATTNETEKWSDLREDVKDGMVWRAIIADVKDEYPGPLEPSIVYDAEHYADNSKRRGVMPLWKKEVKFWFIRTKRGVQPVRKGTDQAGNEVDVPDERWRHVKRMKGIVNVYDLGFVDNLKDGLFRCFQ